METQEKFLKASALRDLAEDAMKSGNTDQAAKYVEEMEHIQAEAQKEAKVHEALAEAKTVEQKATNRVPIAAADIKEDALNEKRSDGTGRSHVDGDYKPSGWNKSLPAMSQISWVQDQMGSNLKAEARFQKDTFAKWFSSKSEETFFRNASADEKKAMEQGTDAEGGFLVPEEFINDTVLVGRTPGGRIAPECTVINVNSKDGYIPTLGVATFANVAEEGAYTGAESTPVNGQIAFAIEKYGGLIRVSDELLDNSVPNLPGLLNEIFSQSYGRLEDSMVTGGDGSGEFNGIIGGTDYSGSATQTYVTSSVSALTAADVLGTYFDVPAQHRGVDSFRWITTSEIMSIISGIGTAAAGVHAIQSLTNAPDAFLLGRGVITSDNAASDLITSLGANKKIAVAGDMSGYYVFRRAGMSIRRNDSLYMGNGQVGFFASVRSDGAFVRDNFTIMTQPAS
jgi:HK97 family phage major capsid protein|tara:strand:+ start:260 stop:1618 length:1359 start_codon:yes stop_codon:yes gene_type:complete